MSQPRGISRVLGRGYVGLVLFFLYAPILVMALMSFNASEFYAFPLSFTLDWYRRLWGNADIVASAWRSLWIAVATTAIATVLGTAAALALFPSGRRRELLTLTLEDRAAAQNLRTRMAETAGPESAAALNAALRPLCGAEAPLWNAAQRSPLGDALLHPRLP